MNYKAVAAQSQVEDTVSGLSPEETIEILDAIIEEAYRIKEIAESEKEEAEKSDDSGN